jgi:hypothetical protein
VSLELSSTIPLPLFAMVIVVVSITYPDIISKSIYDVSLDVGNKLDKSIKLKNCYFTMTKK